MSIIISRCGWCCDEKDKAHEEVMQHAQTCDSNPLVIKIRELEAELADTRGRAGRLGDELTALHGKVTELETHLQSAGERVAELESENEDLRGRALGIDGIGLRDAIRALLKTESTAGELRRALGELVR